MLKNLWTYLLIAISLIACANNPLRSYKDNADEMLTAINTSAVPIESKVFGNPNDILFYMEYGTYLRMTSNYSASDLQFALAQKIVDSWIYSWKNSTGGDISTTTTQMLVNDNALDYQAKGYEKTMLSAYRALNHIDTNNWNNARVEIKKMYEAEQAIANYNQALYIEAQADAKKRQNNIQKNKLYATILKKYDFSDINSPQVLALKNSYQSAFSHYLAGFIFEALGEISLSRPGYLQAGQLAPLNKLPPKSLDNIDNGNLVKPGYTNVLIIQETGHAPQLQSEEIHIPFTTTINGQSCMTNINVFFPILITDKQNSHDVNYTIDGNPQTQELFTNVDLMSARSLHDNMPHLITRNIVAAIRNIGTSVASCSVGGDTGTLLNFASIITGALLDRADERTWTLLPSKIYLNRMQLPYGTHTLTLNINGITYRKSFTLSMPYQIIDMRIVGNKFYLNTQNS